MSLHATLTLFAPDLRMAASAGWIFVAIVIEAPGTAGREGREGREGRAKDAKESQRKYLISRFPFASFA
jgi:hypothetical protein